VDGSFTWVASRYLKPTEGNLAVVTEEGVQARVGSQFSDIRDVVQVRLQKGEVVELLDRPERGPARAENAWVRIAPPAGEFRWVSNKYLDADYPRDGLRRAPVAQREPPRQTEEVAAAVGPDDSVGPVIPAAAMEEAAREPNEAGDDSLRARSMRSRSLSAREFQAELDRVELELSLMVIEEPSAWSFDKLRARSEMLLDQAETAVERGRARLLVNKIARFDDIKQRNDAVLAVREETDRNSRLLISLQPKEGGPERKHAARFDIDGRFDGVGQLTEVVSPKAGAPRYVLVDDTGAVRYYVTPAPGMNLHNLVGRQVGVIGNRGYIPEQHASHIMARHVTPLDGPALR
jgi:hypothetical protein